MCKRSGTPPPSNKPCIRERQAQTTVKVVTENVDRVRIIREKR